MSAQSVRTRRGLPFWVLPATLPLALSLGFVAGMGLAHHRLAGIKEPVHAAPVQVGAPQSGGPAIPSNTQPPPPLETVTLNPAHLHPTQPGPVASKPIGGTVTEPLDPIPANPVPSGGGPVSRRPDPGEVYTVVKPSPPAIRSIVDARLALQNDQTGISQIPGLEYQQMRNAGGSVSLVGMLTVEQYMTWESTLRREPASLKLWLQSAADLVLGPAQTERFALSWALVETRVSAPSWALPSEVTPLQDGRFLVVRYLAGTTGLGQAKVEVRSPDSLGSPVDPNASWSRFGPQIRFDGTDIYRPSGVNGTAPKAP